MYLNTLEVANRLQVTKMTISRMVKKGILKPVNNHNRYFMFDAKQVDCLTSKTATPCNK
jgi:predicted site-specific integrase-resolvase